MKDTERDGMINEETKEKYKDKILIGRSKWYKLMDLIVSRLTRNDNKLDIARFAYVLGRINHTANNKENYDKFKKNHPIKQRIYGEDRLCMAYR